MEGEVKRVGGDKGGVRDRRQEGCRESVGKRGQGGSYFSGARGSVGGSPEHTN